MNINYRWLRWQIKIWPHLAFAQICVSQLRLTPCSQIVWGHNKISLVLRPTVTVQWYRTQTKLPVRRSHLWRHGWWLSVLVFLILDVFLEGHLLKCTRLIYFSCTMKLDDFVYWGHMIVLIIRAPTCTFFAPVAYMQNHMGTFNFRRWIPAESDTHRRYRKCHGAEESHWCSGPWRWAWRPWKGWRSWFRWKCQFFKSFPLA